MACVSENYAFIVEIQILECLETFVVLLSPCTAYRVKATATHLGCWFFVLGYGGEWWQLLATVYKCWHLIVRITLLFTSHALCIAVAKFV